jgi:preprotein translocase subunit SecG
LVDRGQAKPVPLASAHVECTPASAILARVVGFFAFVHVLLSFAVIGLVLMHSGREAGMGGLGFTPASQGGTHIVERNLTRLTVAVSVLFATNTVIIWHLLS